MACTKDDEENVMTCLQAKKLGVAHVELVINKPDYEQVLQNISGFLNFESIVSPRRVTVSEIKKLVTDKNYSVIGSLRGGSIEFVELKVGADSPAAGRPLRALPLPPAGIIAAIVNGSGAKVPGASDSVSAGDRLIVILEKRMAPEVVKMFVK